MTPTAVDLPPAPAAWAKHQVTAAHHEAAHAVAQERLGSAEPVYLALEGSPDAPGRDGFDGRVHSFVICGASPRNVGISMLAGRAAELELAGESAALDADEIRFLTEGGDTPVGVDDAELGSLWSAAVDFVEQNWSQIQAVAAALLAAPATPDSGMTHFLPAQDFRRALEDVGSHPTKAAPGGVVAPTEGLTTRETPPHG